jgi:uncharacterized membrane protein
MPPSNRSSGPGPGPERPLPPAWEALLTLWPALRRHPHPFAAHFPIVFLLATTGCNCLYLLTGVRALEVTAFYCLGGGVVTIPVAILTGMVTHRLNYAGQAEGSILLEKRLSLLLWTVAGGALAWRWLDPEVLVRDWWWGGVLYFLLILAVTPLVTVISYFGGLLTFPLEEE